MKPAAVRRYRLTVFKSVGGDVYGGKVIAGPLDFLINRLVKMFGPSAPVTVVGRGYYSINSGDAELCVIDTPVQRRGGKK